VNPVFLDTSGLIAVANADDQWHDAAEAVWRSLVESRVRLITTSLVLVELGDGLSRIQHRQLALDIFDRLRASPRVSIVDATPDHTERGWQLFRQRSDKEWGVTDCVSIVVMRDCGVTKVFSSDHHFEQAGFEVLLKP
jgi:uncharacterized protein